MTFTILGARAGTSAIARATQIMGASIGNDLEPRYYEERSFKYLNQRLCEKGRPKTLKLEQLKEMREVIEANRTDGVWGWKNPLTGYLIDAYKLLIPGLVFIWCRRDIKKMAKSANRINGGGDWVDWFKNYELIIESSIRNHWHMVIWYEELIKRPDKVMYKLCDFLKLDEKKVPEAIKTIRVH